MINPIELIQDYKDQGYSCEEAVQLAKQELKEKKAFNLASNINATKHQKSRERTALKVQDRYKINL